jgi:hypothetical protein
VDEGANCPQDANNIQPRLGFAFTLNDKTVIRGGSGKYYADVIASNWTMSSRSLSVAFLQINNDGRPDFAANPLNGAPLPTYQQALPRFCYVSNVTGCLDRAAAEQAPQASCSHLAHDWQSSIGFQRQLGADMSVESDSCVYRADAMRRCSRTTPTSLSTRPRVRAYPFSRTARPARFPVGSSRRTDVHRLVQLSRSAIGPPHEALQPPVAGSADLYAVGAARRPSRHR